MICGIHGIDAVVLPQHYILKFGKSQKTKRACRARKNTILLRLEANMRNAPITTRRLFLAISTLSTIWGDHKVTAGEIAEPPVPIYFGNGCFWGRQKDFVDTEKKLGRKPEEISAVVGYAGGREATGDSNGPVCYYYGKPGTIYEDLGHAEVVKLDLNSDPQMAQKEMESFASTFFSQFQRTRDGMQRLDPQDAGPAYRNVVGLPGGVKSPLFKILQEKNVNGMKLVAAEGNSPGKITERDQVGVVYVLDTGTAPFHLAEQYHQFHNGIGVPFGPDYTKKQKRIAQKTAKIGPTGCPELAGFLSF